MPRVKRGVTARAAHKKVIARAAPKSLEDVRAAPALIGFSDGIGKEQLELKRFLNDSVEFFHAGSEKKEAVHPARAQPPFVSPNLL